MLKSTRDVNLRISASNTWFDALHPSSIARWGDVNALLDQPTVTPASFLRQPPVPMNPSLEEALFAAPHE